MTFLHFSSTPKSLSCPLPTYRDERAAQESPAVGGAASLYRYWDSFGGQGCDAPLMMLLVTLKPSHLLPIPTKSPWPVFCPHLPCWLCWGFSASVLETDSGTLSPFISSLMLKEIAEPLVVMNLNIMKPSTHLFVQLLCCWHPLKMDCPNPSPVGKGEKPC